MCDTMAAWLAYAYTATGLVLAAAIFLLVVEGGDGAFRLAFAAMVAATLVAGSLAFPVYYMAASWAVQFRRWRGDRP